MRFFVSLVCFALVLSAETSYEIAYKQYKAQNYEKALELFTQLAKNNDYDAAYILGFMYEHGEGCKVDLERSNKWYKIASHGYYWQRKPDPTRDTDKERRKLYASLNKSDNDKTQHTIRQYTESLYNIKAYNANYFLPISYRYEGEYADTYGHEAQAVETEFQVSIKYDFGLNMLGLNEVYSVAYTQKSFWQFYSESAYFRESNYNPELFLTIPTSNKDDEALLKAVRFSFAHQSNGRGGQEERSWNYLSGSGFFQFASLFAELKLWYRLPDATDYNPELLDYMGHGYLKFSFPYEKHLAQVKLMQSFYGYGSVEANYSYPLFADDMFLYIKTFNGYGESLIDYDNYINKASIGFSISR